jgi:hypothetical protein
MDDAPGYDADTPFPLTAISRDHKFYDKVSGALKTAITQWKLSQLDPDSSNLLFWHQALYSIGVIIAPIDVEKTFNGKANAACADIFLELATDILNMNHVLQIPSRVGRMGQMKSSLRQRIQGEALC